LKTTGCTPEQVLSTAQVISTPQTMPINRVSQR
jgi:hypothetical protein